jgi:NAD(P)H-dependent FMN reductase
MNAKPILIISGTNRPNSSTIQVARRVAGHYQTLGVRAALYSLTELPPELFDPDSYATKPERFLPIQRHVVESAGLHLVTPEYNGSFPGVLKYFIDMLRFPESFERKPVAFIGVAAGTWGALRPVEQLQMIFGYRNAHLYPERVFIPQVTGKLSADGGLADPAIDQRIAQQVAGFSHFAHGFKAGAAVT